MINTCCIVCITLVAVIFTFDAGFAKSAKKPVREMSFWQKVYFVQNGGLRGKCKYAQCFSFCMKRYGIDQWSNAKCAEACSRVIGCN